MAFRVGFQVPMGGAKKAALKLIQYNPGVAQRGELRTGEVAAQSNLATMKIYPNQLGLSIHFFHRISTLGCYTLCRLSH
jgi:hypothetical protein